MRLNWVQFAKRCEIKMKTIRLTEEEVKILCGWLEIDEDKFEEQFKHTIEEYKKTEEYKKNTPELFKGDIYKLKKYLDIKTIARLYEEV